MSFFSELADAKVSKNKNYGNYEYITAEHLGSFTFLIHALEKADGPRIFLKGEVADGPHKGKQLKQVYQCFGKTMWKLDKALNDILDIAGAKQEFKDAGKAQKEEMLTQFYGGKDGSMDPKQGMLRGSLVKVSVKPNAKQPKFQDVYFTHIDGQTVEEIVARRAELEAKGV